MTKTPKPSESQGAVRSRLASVLRDLVLAVGPDEARRVLDAAFAEAAGCLERGSTSAPPGGSVAEPANRDALRYDYREIVGRSPAILGILATLDRVIDSELPILVTGESGTGKELVARAVHEHSRRKDRAFVRENCAAIPESLLESELFGYRKGAFTGAIQDKRGLFEEGDGGSVFLDEIGEMSLSMQAKLMRVLQEGEIRPVGAPATIRVDVRLISATNRDLRKLVADGRFREDLFFRLNVVAIRVPALRERKDDIPLLVDAFLARAASRARARPKSLAPEALACLMTHDWPGNVRELENEIQRAFALSGPKIKVEDLSPEVGAASRRTRQSSNPKAR